MLGKLGQEEGLQPIDRDWGWRVVGIVALIFFSIQLAL